MSIPAWGHTLEYLRIFRAVLAETGNAENALWVVLQEDRRRRDTIDPTGDMAGVADAIIDETCRLYTVERKTLLGPCRARQVARCRWIAMRAMRDEGMSLPLIGRYMHRDHSSVMYGLAVLARSEESVEAAQEIRRRVVGKVGEGEAAA